MLVRMRNTKNASHIMKPLALYSEPFMPALVRKKCALTNGVDASLMRNTQWYGVVKWVTNPNANAPPTATTTTTTNTVTNINRILLWVHKVVQ